MGFRLSWLAWLLVLGCCLVTGRARADSPIDFATVTTQLELATRVEVLEDREAALTPGQALARTDWRRASPSSLNFGVTRSAVWLRLTVWNRSDRSQLRWLTLGSPRLEEVGYYRFVPGDSEPVEQAVSGLLHPMSKRPEPGLVSIFPVRLAPGEASVLLLRAEGRTRLMLMPGLWEPLSYRVYESDQALRQLVPYCILLGLIVYMFVYSLMHQPRNLLLFAIFLASMVLFELSFGGYLYRFVLQAGGEIVVRANVILSTLSLALGAGFTLLALRLYEHRVWNRVYGLFIAGSLVLAMQATFGDLFISNKIIIYFLTLFLCVWQVSTVVAWRRGVAYSGMFLLSSLGLWGGVFLRIAQQLGLLPMDAFDEEIVPVRPALLLGVAMVFSAVRTNYLEQRAFREAQATLFKGRQDEHARLESVVLERTRSLQAAVIAADEANRVRSDLLARVNHDLKRPTTDILELTMPLERTGGEQAEYAASIHRSASDLLGLIDDLIEESGSDNRLGAVRPEVIDLRSFLDGLATEAEGLALVQGNSFVWQPGADLPARVSVDPKRLRQILINLLDNAAKFTRSGRIELQVRVAMDAGVMTLICSVSDTGVGMSAAQLAEVFEPYSRAEEARGVPGLGLGLAIALHWIERMGGGIAVDSMLGQGTTMRVTLPLSQPGTVDPPAAGTAERSLDILSRPDDSQLEQARSALRLGAISDLIEWAAGLVLARPECRDFAERVADLAARGDLKGVAHYLRGDDVG